MGQVTPVVLAGGTGSRLWPLSRELFPKQFHALVGEGSLLQSTLLRGKRVCGREPIIVCNEEHRFLVAEHCRAAQVGWQRIILEPEGRNTAPAIALAALAALDASIEGGDPLLLVLPSDHLIEDVDALNAAVTTAAAAASAGGLVTFGVKPTRPETGYGYIEVDAEPIAGVHRVRAFVEKPNERTARGYVESGNHYWNSGMFLLQAGTYLRELQRLQPEIFDRVSAAYASGTDDLDFFRPGPEFLDSPADSIDYAVMEKTTLAKLVPATFDWSDIGSWTALWEISERDAKGNYLRGDVLGLGTRDCYVSAQDRLVATVGVEKLIVVETSDAVLVAHQDHVQDIKTLVHTLKGCKREEHVVHREVFRPWGSYECVGNGEGYQVKRIKVKPGASLSLQKHRHRAEHWVVVRGTADVTRGDDVFRLGANESTYIPVGVVHRLHNPEETVLELIEVQAGDYLGEDDIERFEDIYGR